MVRFDPCLECATPFETRACQACPIRTIDEAIRKPGQKDCFGLSEHSCDQIVKVLGETKR